MKLEHKKLPMSGWPLPSKRRFHVLKRGERQAVMPRPFLMVGSYSPLLYSIKGT